MVWDEIAPIDSFYLLVILTITVYLFLSTIIKKLVKTISILCNRPSYPIAAHHKFVSGFLSIHIGSMLLFLSYTFFLRNLVR